MFQQLLGQFQYYITKIIRPARFYYQLQHLGPQVFQVGQQLFQRKDFQLLNFKSQVLQCSMFSLKNSPIQQRPCIVFSHCNCGSRIEALQYLNQILLNGFNLLAFDFSGSGLSDGEFISLGINESQDLKVIISYLKSCGIKQIFIWGRSSGAVAALFYTQLDANIKACVYDSPFSSLRSILKQQAIKYIDIPQFLISGLLIVINFFIQEKAGFNINDCNSKKAAKNNLGIPGIFIASIDDSLVPYQKIQDVYQKYKCEKKQLLLINGEHNSKRSKQDIQNILDFLLKHVVQSQKYQINQFINSAKLIQHTQVNQIFQCSKSKLIMKNKQKENNQQNHQQLQNPFAKQIFHKKINSFDDENYFQTTQTISKSQSQSRHLKNSSTFIYTQTEQSQQNQPYQNKYSFINPQIINIQLSSSYKYFKQ